MDVRGPNNEAGCKASQIASMTINECRGLEPERWQNDIMTQRKRSRPVRPFLENFPHFCITTVNEWIGGKKRDGKIKMHNGNGIGKKDFLTVVCARRRDDVDGGKIVNELCFEVLVFLLQEKSDIVIVNDWNNVAIRKKNRNSWWSLFWVLSQVKENRKW